jgi:hypothetical protein
VPVEKYYTESVINLKAHNQKGGRTMKNKTVILLALAMAASIAFFAPSDASAYNLNGECDASELAAYECFETVNNWVLEIVRGVNGIHAGDFPVYCDGTDMSAECRNKQGRPVKGYRFAYQATAPGSGYNLVQANVLTEDCGEGNLIQVVDPPSVKMRTHDPNTGYGAGDPDYVITWDSLKLDVSNHANFAVFTTRAGAGPKGALLTTDTTLEYVDAILGPICCTQAHIGTNVDFAVSIPGSQSFDTFATVEYDSCTGDPRTLSASCNNNLCSNSGTTCEVDADCSPEEIKAKICIGDSDGPTLNTCHEIKKFGFQKGGFINACSDKDTPYEKNYAYFGAGNRIYRIHTSDTCNDFTGSPAPSGLQGTCKKRELIDGIIEVVYVDCLPKYVCTGDDIGEDPNPPDVCEEFRPLRPLNPEDPFLWIISTTDFGKGMPKYDVQGFVTDASALGVPTSNAWVYLWGNWYWY